MKNNSKENKVWLLNLKKKGIDFFCHSNLANTLLSYLLIPKELMGIFRKKSSNVILKIFRKTNCLKEKIYRDIKYIKLKILKVTGIFISRISLQLGYSQHFSYLKCHFSIIWFTWDAETYKQWKLEYHFECFSVKSLLTVRIRKQASNLVFIFCMFIHNEE